MRVVQLPEQIPQGTSLSTIVPKEDTECLLQCLEKGSKATFSVRRGRSDEEPCLMLTRSGEEITASGSYFVGIDWLKVGEVAVQVSPKMNLKGQTEVDYVRMLNDALSEPENYDHLRDLVTIRFDFPSIKIRQQQDLLSVFLITEYLNVLQRIVVKGLKKSFYMVEENLQNKVKGRILVGENLRKNLVKGHITDNVCRYQVYGIDSLENRVLKMALRFCTKQLETYKHAIDTSILEKKARFVRPYFAAVGEEGNLKRVKTYKGNPLYKDYYQAIEFAQLLLRRYSYDIVLAGEKEISTPPFWIDMSKLFELYVFHHLRQIFTAKNEISYHVNAHRQELDYLLKPQVWENPYVIDAKYKPQYKGTSNMDDAREVAGYARLTEIYKRLGLDENVALPIKCLIVYPDQDKEEKFTFTREEEPKFDKISGYVRFYKVGIRLPEVSGT